MGITRYTYRWPHADLAGDSRWLAGPPGFRQRAMPETTAELAEDSRWPAFFPCPLAVVTTIDGDSVVVESGSVKSPAFVRYAWADNPECTLYNGAGLPASPFRTDN